MITTNPGLAKTCDGTELTTVEKCKKIFDVAEAINGITDNIDGNLFGFKPCETSAAKQPCSIDDYLNCIVELLTYTFNVLNKTNNKLS